MRQTPSVPPFEGIIVMLARLNSASQPRIHDDVGKAIAAAFRTGSTGPEPQMVSFECLGRYDAIYVLRAPTLAFQPIARMKYVRGLKKLDVQYGYIPGKDAHDFWQAASEGKLAPLLLVTYVRVRDDYTYLTGGAIHDNGARPALSQAAARREFPVTLVARGIGWPDYMVITASSDLDKLTDFVRSDVRGLACTSLDEAAVADIKAELSRSGEDFRGSEPVFSRTYTVLGYPREPDFSGVSGKVRNAQVDLRVRPGADADIAALAQSILGGSADFDTEATVHFGCQDAALWLSPHGPDGIEASSLFTPYHSRFMDATKHLVTTTEMRIGLAPSTDSCMTHVPDPGKMELVDPPRELMTATEPDEAVLSQPVAAGLRRACAMANWAIVNEGIHRDFVDLHRQTKAFVDFTARTVSNNRYRHATPRLLDEVSLNARLFSEAFSQRLAGSYYDLCADSPEVLLEYPGGIQKLVAALYAVLHPLLSTATSLLKVDAVEPCCMISKEAEPAQCVLNGSSFAIRLCSSLAFAPDYAVYPVAHEAGHMLRHIYVSALSVPPRERSRNTANVQYLWAKFDDESGRFWFEPDLDRLRKWLDASGSTVPPYWRADCLAEAGRVLEETFADVTAFLLLDADLPAYQRDLLRVLARAQGSVAFPLTYWVVSEISQELARRKWPRASAAGRPLLDWMADGEPLDSAQLLKSPVTMRSLPGITSLSPGPRSTAKEVWSEGWTRAQELGFTEAPFLDCLRSTVDYAQALLLSLRDPARVGREAAASHRAGIDALRRLGAPAQKGATFDPGALEQLWGQAMAAFRPA